MLCLLFIMSTECSCTILQCGCHRVIKLTPAVSMLRIYHCCRLSKTRGRRCL